MKMKKIAAASLAVCVCALSGMSALADTAPTVVTTTGYFYGDGTEKTDAIEVYSKVTGVEAGKQVTYLVWNGNENGISYIDQKAAGTDGSADFTFKAAQNKLYPSTYNVVAKFGTDDANRGALPTFELKQGVNFVTDGTATHNSIDTPNDFNVTDVTKATGAQVKFGTFSGNVKEYGVTVTVDGVSKEFPAVGATWNAEKTMATFCVVFEGLPAGATLDTYAR